MKKFVLPLLLVPLFMSCRVDHDYCDCHENHDHDHDLGTIKLNVTQGDRPFDGILDIFSCRDSTFEYVGNYNYNRPSVLNPSCSVNNGSIVTWGLPLLLPVGEYNIVYWGTYSGTDIYEHSYMTSPALKLGANLDDLYWTLRESSDGDAYIPVLDQVMAVKETEVGGEGIGVDLQRVVAGITVIIQNGDASAFDEEVLSFDVTVGGIAEGINVATAEPRDQTKTVAFNLTMAKDRLSATNKVAMVYPSAPSPQVVITANLANGTSKSYTTNLENSLDANVMQKVTVIVSDILSGDPGGSTFSVESWVESSEVIDAPAF